MKKIINTIICMTALGVMPIHASIIYVDASTNNTTLANGDPLTTDGSGQNWEVRTFGNGGTIYEADHTDDSPEIKTTISLADGTYELYAYYWDNSDTGSSGQWNLAAGLTAGALSQWGGNTPNGQAPTAVSEDFAIPTPVVFESGSYNRTLYQISLGQVAVTSGFVNVYIDHVNDGNSDRSWYDGVGYRDLLGVHLSDTIVPLVSVPGTLVGTLEMVSTNSAGFSYTLDTTGDHTYFDIPIGTNELYTAKFLDTEVYVISIVGTKGAFAVTNDFTITTTGNPFPRIFGVEFNRNDAYASPSQSGYRIISGSTTQSSNSSSYVKTIGNHQVTISQPDAVKFEFRGANSDSGRDIPGGDVSMSYLVADFITTRKGAIDITIANLAAGSYIFRSFHLDTTNGTGLGFAQGATSTTPNTIEARLGGLLQDSTQANALSSPGLNTTFINDDQIPTLGFGFTHDGTSPLTINLSSTTSNGVDNFLLLNGFEILEVSP